MCGCMRSSENDFLPGPCNTLLPMNCARRSYGSDGCGASPTKSKRCSVRKSWASELARCFCSQTTAEDKVHLDFPGVEREILDARERHRRWSQWSRLWRHASSNRIPPWTALQAGRRGGQGILGTILLAFSLSLFAIQTTPTPENPVGSPAQMLCPQALSRGLARVPPAPSTLAGSTSTARDTGSTDVKPRVKQMG